MNRPGIFDKQGLIAHLRAQFQINWMGHHGIPHWMRVRANGIMLARFNGSNIHVLEYSPSFMMRGESMSVGTMAMGHAGPNLPENFAVYILTRRTRK